MRGNRSPVFRRRRLLHQWPELDALVDAALAATTFEEQQKWVREVDMDAIETGRERGAAVLVGTPGPAGASQHHECVLWSRLGIGLLSAAATRAALVEPLAGHGVRIDADALDAAVEHCQR